MEDKMLEIITKSFEEKIENGDFKKIVDKKLEEMMSSVIDDLVRWNGPVKDYFKKEMESIMMGVVKNTDFTEYCNVIKDIINKSLPQTALPEYKDFVEGLQSTLGKPSLSIKTVKLSEIFKEYCDYIENQSFDHDYVDDIDEGKAYVNCLADYEEEDGYYFKSKKMYVTFKTDIEEDSHEQKIEIYNGYKSLHLKVDFDKVSDYRYLNSFQLYLLQLSNCHAEIIIDDESFEDSVCCDVEY